MKRHFAILTLMLGFLFITQSGECAPAYGTKLPEKGHIFVGAQSHSIFKRYLENEYGKVRSWQQFLLLSYGITDWLSIDLKGGAGYIKQRPVDSSEVDYSSSFSGGYGFRVRIYDNVKNKVKAVFGFQHISVHPKSIHLEGTKNKAVLDDWQVSILISKEFRGSTPYIGGKWSRVDYIHWVNDDRKRKMSDLTKSIGMVVGVDIPLDERTYFNLETQFFDGQVLSLSIFYKI